LLALPLRGCLSNPLARLPKGEKGDLGGLRQALAKANPDRSVVKKNLKQLIINILSIKTEPFTDLIKINPIILVLNQYLESFLPLPFELLTLTPLLDSRRG
jgi:hypothetical protein